MGIKGNHEYASQNSAQKRRICPRKATATINVEGMGERQVPNACVGMDFNCGGSAVCARLPFFSFNVDLCSRAGASLCVGSWVRKFIVPSQPGRVDQALNAQTTTALPSALPSRLRSGAWSIPLHEARDDGRAKLSLLCGGWERQDPAAREGRRVPVVGSLRGGAVRQPCHSSVPSQRHSSRISHCRVGVLSKGIHCARARARPLHVDTDTLFLDRNTLFLDFTLRTCAPAPVACPRACECMTPSFRA